MSKTVACPECGDGHMRVLGSGSESIAVECSTCGRTLIWFREDKRITHPDLEL